jgi:ADP-heptose:LPS heptosyltransferase
MQVEKYFDADSVGAAPADMIDDPDVAPVEQFAINKADLHRAFTEADRIVINMKHHTIGGTIIRWAYVLGVDQGLQLVGRDHVPIDVITNEDHDGIFNPGATSHIRLHELPEYNREAEENGNTLIAVNKGEKVLVWDLRSSYGEYGRLKLEPGKDPDKMHVKNFYSRAYLEQFPYRMHGIGRFARIVEDIFSLPPLDPKIVRPHLRLPAEAEFTYEDFVERFGIDRDRRQITINVVGSLRSKQYPYLYWRWVAEKIAKKHPDYQYNIVYDSGGYKYDIEEIRKTFGENAGKMRFNLVHGNLAELAAFYRYQHLVLSNDTGVAHLAATVEDGPHVVTLFEPQKTPSDTWRSSERMVPIELEGEALEQRRQLFYRKFGEPRHQMDLISITQVANTALSLLPA